MSPIPPSASRNSCEMNNWCQVAPVMHTVMLRARSNVNTTPAGYLMPGPRVHLNPGIVNDFLKHLGSVVNFPSPFVQGKNLAGISTSTLGNSVRGGTIEAVALDILQQEIAGVFKPGCGDNTSSPPYHTHTHSRGQEPDPATLHYKKTSPH